MLIYGNIDSRIGGRIDCSLDGKIDCSLDCSIDLVRVGVCNQTSLDCSSRW